MRVLNLNVVNDPLINSEVVAGSGERCVPGDINNCGDNGPAIEAKLSHPKGEDFYFCVKDVKYKF